MIESKHGAAASGNLLKLAFLAPLSEVPSPERKSDI
jgi:hypothetical protein